MINFLDYFVLTPLRLFFQGLYEVILIVVSNYGIGIICLSCVTAIILIPIEKAVRGSILKEQNIESVLLPQLTEIKHKYNGIEKNNAIKRLYSRYGYSPLYAIRNVFGVFVQLPFLIGAYLMLSQYSNLNGQSFLFIKDLSLEDHLLGDVNLLPFLMTLINLSTLFFLKLSKKENIQTGIIAFSFLLLLYKAPSALLLYWTMNNIIHLLRAAWKKYICFDEYKHAVFDNVRIFFDKYSQTTIIKYLKIQLIDKTESEFYKKDWCYFIILIFCLPLIQISNNFGYYSPEQVSRSTILLLIISVCIVLFFKVLRLFCINNRIKRHFFVWTILFLGASICYETFYSYFFSNSFSKFYRILIMGGAEFLLFIILRFKYSNVLLFLNVVISVLYGGINNYCTRNDFVSSIENNVNNEAIELNEKPNIYYILCESMNSLDIAQNTYGLDKETADGFVGFLQDNGFYVPDFVYSNSDYTLKTMQNIYLMRDYVGGSKGNMDGSTAVRPTLSGNEYNKLLKILKHNNYYNSSYMMDLYFESPKGPYLDFYDIENKSLNNFSALTNSPKIIYNIIFRYLFDNNETINIEKDSFKIIDKYFENEPSCPHFMFHRPLYLGHSGDEAYSSKGRKSWLKGKYYLDGYLKEIEALKYITKKIIENDSNAVIIMIGDHGAHLYRSRAKNIDDLEFFLKENGITYEEFINDKFKVFAAVRIPKKYEQIDGMFSPGNIFPLLFDKIGYRGERIDISKNNSYYIGYSSSYVSDKVPVIKDGKIVKLDSLKNEIAKY